MKSTSPCLWRRKDGRHESQVVKRRLLRGGSFRGPTLRSRTVGTVSVLSQISGVCRDPVSRRTLTWIIVRHRKSGVETPLVTLPTDLPAGAASIKTAVPRHRLDSAVCHSIEMYIQDHRQRATE